MPGIAYQYFVPYQPDAGQALEELKARERAAGRYHKGDGPTGTRSILDIRAVGDEPAGGTAVRLDDEELEHFYGTKRPTRAAVEADMSFYADIARGQAVYFVIYEGDQPTEIFFGGYSYD
jgi:hypothetical protein